MLESYKGQGLGFRMQLRGLECRRGGCADVQDTSVGVLGSWALADQGSKQLFT